MNRRDFLLASSALVAGTAKQFPRLAPNVCFAMGNRDSAVRGAGLGLAGLDTERVYFTYNGKPLLSFGGLSDMTFYAAEDAYDYKRWTDWAVAHGMNHLRAYPPQSGTIVDEFIRNNGGALDNVLFPYQETRPGSRKFDLTKFDERYWKRFREQCEYLEAKGVIVHLLMWTGWLTQRKGPRAHLYWGGHFYNPRNNVNAFTSHLRDHPERIYSSVADGVTELIRVQKAWYRKLISATHDLNNVYYDLIHEIFHRDSFGFESWPKAQRYVDEMAATVLATWDELQPDRKVILGMDAAGLEGVSHTKRRTPVRAEMPRRGSQVAWVFTRPYFNLLIWGWAHGADNAREWRKKYKKPYIPQECFDDNGQNYAYRHPEMRVHTRKYMWKFMLAKCQQIDLYVTIKRKPWEGGHPDYSTNYDPNGWNRFEDDAPVLRAFWDRLRDCRNLWFDGAVKAGPGSHQYVLSSRSETVAYCSSPTGKQNQEYPPSRLVLEGLAADNGRYRAEVVKPDAGIVRKLDVRVTDGTATIDLPAFVNDVVVHLYRAEH